MPPQLIRCRAELAVFQLIARQGAEEVAVQARDECGERRPSRVVEAYFTDVLGGGLRRLEAHGMGLLELQHHREEAMPKGLGVATGAGELLSSHGVRP